MGESSEEIAANSCGSENNGLGSSEAHHVGGCPQEDRGHTKGTVGEDTGAAEEGGLVDRGACCGYAAGFRACASSQLLSAPVDPHKQKRGNP